MTDILSTLASQLGPSAIQQISQQIGAEPAQTQSAVQAALPTLLTALSNNAHTATVSALRGLTDRFLVLGGGGYNPWTVGRLWACVWAELNGRSVPSEVGNEVSMILKNLSWNGSRKGRPPSPDLLNTLRDRPRPGAVRPEVEARVEFYRRSGVL